MHLVIDERYPYYRLEGNDEDSGWIPNAVLPEGSLTAEELADYRRVEALWEAWQTRLSELHRQFKVNAETPT